MAIITIVTAGYVRRVLALRGRPVVAREAGAENLGVIDRPGRIPCRCAMAVFADICSADVTWILP